MVQLPAPNPTPRVTNRDIKFTLKPDFLHVLRLVPGANQRQCIFTLPEITFLFSRYIPSRKNFIFDPRNTLVALVENDPLGKAFGVRAFHRDQALRLIHSQITPILPNLIQDIKTATPSMIAPEQKNHMPPKPE